MIGSTMRIVYNSFNGRYSDNPRAIYEELTRRGLELEHVRAEYQPGPRFMRPWTYGYSGRAVRGS